MRALPLAVRVLVGLVLLAVALVGADRLSAAGAERLVARQVAASLGPDAQVRAELPRPFLPSFVRGRYDAVYLSVSGSLPGVRVQDSGLLLGGVQVAPWDLVRGGVQRIPVSALQLSAGVSWEEVSRLAGDGLRLGPSEDGLVRVTGSTSVLGRTVEVAAVAEVAVQDGLLAVSPQRFETGNGLADGVLRRAVGNRFTLRLDPGPLPFGVVPSGVLTDPLGVRLEASSGPTVLDLTAPAGE